MRETWEEVQRTMVSRKKVEDRKRRKEMTSIFRTSCVLKWSQFVVLKRTVILKMGLGDERKWQRTLGSSMWE